MASHLTVITGTAGASASKGLNAAAGLEAEGGGADSFAALLGTPAPQTSDLSRGTATHPDLNVGNLVQLALGFGEGDEPPRDSEDPELVAGLFDAVVPLNDTAASIPALAELADTLADLETRLAAGQPLPPETLERLDTALDALADALDIDLGALPASDDLTAMLTDIQPDDTGFAAGLTAAIGPVAETLFGGSSVPQAQDDPELSTLVRSIGDKLAALLSALNQGQVEPERMARLEIAAQAEPDLEAALTRLRAPLMSLESGTSAPVLATPELKVTEPVLTGKISPLPEGRASTAPAAQPARAIDAVPAAAGDRPADNEPAPAELKPVERVEPRQAAPAAPGNGPADGQPQAQQLPAARVDIVAAPRVVQAGYQTSQQQLNLPQLAFELVRQVGDGNTRFQIRLDPAELGKIDVRLDIDRLGQVHARLTVEKAETLDLMQRDQKGLERALQQAGLDGAKTNLEFSLRQNPFGGGQQGQQGRNGRQPAFDDGAGVPSDAAPTINLYRGNLSARGINIIA